VKTRSGVPLTDTVTICTTRYLTRTIRTLISLGSTELCCSSGCHNTTEYWRHSCFGLTNLLSSQRHRFSACRPLRIWDHRRSCKSLPRSHTECRIYRPSLRSVLSPNGDDSNNNNNDDNNDNCDEDISNVMQTAKNGITFKATTMLRVLSRSVNVPQDVRISWSSHRTSVWWRTQSSLSRGWDPSR
jgi:hypothetical protein